MLPNIHILGIQGSGKGTQSSLLVEKYAFAYASSGNLFRQRATINDEFGQKVAAMLKTGKLFPNQLVFEVIDEYLTDHQVASGFLGDGVIRTVEQYTGFQPIWHTHGLDTPVLIHLILNEDTAQKRIQQRIADAQDPAKRSYHEVYSGKLVHRSDDNPVAIQERFALFHRMTTPVVKIFDDLGRCIHVSADQSVENIHAEICKGIEAFYPHLSSHGAH